MLSQWPACAAGPNTSSVCGVYGNSCSAIAAKTANAEMTLELYGSDTTGAFSRVFSQYLGSDTYCDGPMQLQYVLNGSFALHGPSTCGGDCSEVHA